MWERSSRESSIVSSGRSWDDWSQDDPIHRRDESRRRREAPQKEKYFNIQSPRPTSKKTRRRTLIAIYEKLKSWTNVLKATWAVWSPRSDLLRKLKSTVKLDNLPSIEKDDIQLLMDVLREEAESQWRIDVDMLIGLVLVIDQEAFNFVWDRFAHNITTWAKGNDTKQAARRVELKERLEMCTPLEEELSSWKSRNLKRQREQRKTDTVIEPVETPIERDVDSQLITHEMMAEDWQPEEASEHLETATLNHEDVIISFGGGQTHMETQDQVDPDDETLAISRSGMESVQSEPEPQTHEQTQIPSEEESDEVMETGDSEDDPLYIPRKRRRINDEDSEEEELASGTITEERDKELVEKIVKELGIPSRSQWMETIHALLTVKKLTATVFEPMLAVKDDELADVRAALWPSFRHMEAGLRDTILNESVERLGLRDTKKLFLDATKKLRKIKITQALKDDVDSSLVAKQIYKWIGISEQVIPTCNIVQQVASSVNSEMHFEFLTWSRDGFPMRHAKVESNGDCWLAAVLRQCPSTWHGKITWSEDGSPPREEKPRLVGEIAREKRELKMRINHDNSLVTSFATKCTWIFGAPLKIKERDYPVKMYGMLDAMRLEDTFKDVMSKPVKELVGKGVPLEYAKTLWTIYGDVRKA